MYKPLVSVIVVNFNGEKFIENLLVSLKKTNYPSFEVVLIDNNSTDKSVHIIKKFKEKKSFNNLVIVENKKNLFFTGGCNKGASLAKGKKLIFLNSDTEVDKNWLTELVNFSLRNRKFLVQPKILNYYKPKMIDNVGGILNYLCFGFGRGHNKIDCGQFEKNCQVDFVNGTCFLIERDFFKKLGGFDENFKFFYEDVDLCLRAKKQGGVCWYCCKSTIFHKGGLSFKNSSSLKITKFYSRRNRLLVVIKNSSFLKILTTILPFFMIYLFLSLKDFLSVQFTTIKSFFSALNIGSSYIINRLRILEMKKFINKKKFSLLDIGCGSGNLINLCFAQGIDVLGVDVNTNQVDSKIINTSIEKFETKRKFDIVCLFHSLEHFDSPEIVLAKIRDYLKKDGLLVIETPLVGNVSEKFLKKKYLAYFDKTHKSFFTKEKLLSLINIGGYKVKDYGCTIYEFPFTVITSGFKSGIIKGIIGLLLFIPLKILTILGMNDEILRVYCSKK